MTNKELDLLFQDIIRREKSIRENFRKDGFSNHDVFWKGRAMGLYDAVQTIAFHLGKDIDPYLHGESIVEYYTRWKSDVEKEVSELCTKKSEKN